MTSSFSRQGGIGELTLSRLGLDPLPTPLLFPVVCMMTGTTARGGGLWKYILQANSEHGLLRRSHPAIPLMSQVVHFMDFKVSPNAVEVWRREGLIPRYVEEFPDLKGNNPLFLDSGGFKLLFNKSLDLSNYGLPMDEQQAERIIKLQMELGGDLIATLDYPLPPGLVREEAVQRMQKSQANALKAASYIKQHLKTEPFLFIAVHGQNGQDIERYVSDMFHKMEQKGLADMNFGMAIGSLVPLRGGHKYPIMVELVRGAIRGVPERYRHKTPIHVFGISGNLIPILVYLGVDTFDSSTYAQQARSLRYFNPSSHTAQAVLEMSDLNCDCRVCRELDFDELHESLTSDIRYRPLPSGHYKSKYYADIALHNLEMDFRMVEDVRAALSANEMIEYLARHAQLFPKLDAAFDLLAGQDEQLAGRMSRTTLPVASLPHMPIEEQFFRPISLNYTSDSFCVNSNGYQPPSEKTILLVIPCSSKKPYSESRSHKLLAKRLSKRLSSGVSAIHKVTLSGLYGPVPEEYETEEAVIQYDFQLDPSNKEQISLCSKRMTEYLKQYEVHYQAIFGYATSLAYRSVLEQVEKECDKFKLFPLKPKSRRLTEFFRQKNIVELLDAVASVVEHPEDKKNG